MGASPRAYPRSRGETDQMQEKDDRTQGLSPLARGNRPAFRDRVGVHGPIPARAGKPRKRNATRICQRAYPRSRGETPPPLPFGALCEGLSPLARGNRDGGKRDDLHQGPIPARAGKPDLLAVFVAHLKAYPRSRGETPNSIKPRSNVVGLSPLARGNPLERSEILGRHGPIPARAGKPSQYVPTRGATRAYPRSRGETARHR